jgi:multidrug efflux system outer membrane protein
MRFKSCYALLLLTTLATSCRFGPEHAVPYVETPENWNTLENITTSVPIDPDHSLVCWWEQFNDPYLNEFMERIFTDNLDVLMAFQRITQAVALRKVTSSKLYPDIDGEVAFNHSKPGNFGFAGASALSSILKIDQYTTQTKIDAIWEVDLFGRIRRQIESASANIGIQVEIRDGILISALSEFARNYIQVRGNQKIAALLQEQISILGNQTSLTNDRYTVGIERDVNLQNLQEQLQNLQSNLPPVQTDLYSGIYRLSVLIGKNPDFLIDIIKNSEINLCIPKTIPDVLPSELLRRRPDIRQAERSIAKYTADLGVAYAEIFPKINLTGFDGFERIRILDLLLKGDIWSYGIDVLMPFFKGGRIIGNINYNEALRDEAFLNYRQTVLRAFEETENAMTHFLNASKTLTDRTAAFELQKKIYAHSENQFNVGVISKIDYVNAKRTLLVSEQATIYSQIETGVALVFLYKALGGGW